MIYYIHPLSGDDNNSGMLENQPWRSFGALSRRRLVPGNHVKVLAPGHFYDTLVLRGGGTARTPVTIQFAPGRYDLHADRSQARIYNISNTNDDAGTPKAVGILFEHASHIQVKGAGAKFFCRGKMIEICIDHSEAISVADLTFDYQRPTVSEFAVTAATNEYADLTIHPDSTYRVEDGRIIWEGEGWSYDKFLTQELDPGRSVVRRRKNPLQELKLEALAPGIVRAHGIHDLVKGHVYQQRNTFRDCVGLFLNRSRDVVLKDLQLRFLHGMGILCQFTENITLETVSVAPDPESGRTCSAWADCFHASGCRGRIVVRNCLFDGAHDDAINIHGTYLRVIEQIDTHRIKVRFMHRQTFGFMGINSGDEIDFVRGDSLAAFASNRVSGVEMLTPRDLLITLESPVSVNWQKDEAIENVTWTPEVEISGCTVKRIPTRGFLLSTRRAVRIRDNTFLCLHMNGIDIGSDAENWFESGCVRDMIIAENRFMRCGDDAVRISPQNRVDNNAVHRNIRIMDNIFELDHTKAVYARGTTGLTIAGNTVAGVRKAQSENVFAVDNCADVTVCENRADKFTSTEIKQCANRNRFPEHQWIGAEKNASAPLFRREFGCTRPLAEATLLISGLGYHEAWINGARVGDHVLDPAQTDYELRVFHVRHNVTRMIVNGLNTLGVVLGNGWYNQDRVWGENGFSYGLPRLMAELHLRYADGASDVVRTDTDWCWKPGPITDNNVYAGECYDARLEIDGWRMPGFDDSDWQTAIPVQAPGGKLVEQTMPPMRRVEEIRPVAINEVKPGTFVVDFGRNFSGWNRIQVDAPAGTEIALRCAETVFPDGTIDTASTGVFATKVEQVDRYICRGGGMETWEPRFTYHGFRYVEVTGWPGDLSPEHITGVLVHNDLPVAGTFESSDERLNQLHEMALWTHRSNMHGLPEDCPAREKCGWLGDANLVAEYSLWNYDGKTFWEKFLEDIETTRTFNDGLPGNIAPGKRGSRRKANPDWAAAFIMVPWYLYLFSGDKGIVKRHWQGMQHLMEHFQKKAQDWMLRGGFGDYFDPGADAIVMHTPRFLTTTLWFYRCADVMAVMADALDDPDSAAMYHDWCGRIAAALKDGCYDHTEGSFGSQTANAMALAFNVHPNENRRMLDALVKDIRERDNHMNVGVMGVRVIMEVLTRHGHGNLALALMHQNTYPSFGHLIERGATTLWECWGEEEHDRIHGARSLNHPFMGGYDNWFFNTLAGIRPDAKAPGFTHLFLEPHPVKGLDWVRCHHDCRYGRIASNWRIENDAFHWDVVIPEGTVASAVLPGSEEVIELAAGPHKFIQ